VKIIRKRARLVFYVSVFMVGALLLTLPGAIRPAMGQSSSSLFNFPHFNPPPFDFNDAFYNANGISTAITALDSPQAARFGLFRQTGPPAFLPGQKNWVVDTSNTDPDRNNVRILATTAGYIRRHRRPNPVHFAHRLPAEPELFYRRRQQARHPDAGHCGHVRGVCGAQAG